MKLVFLIACTIILFHQKGKCQNLEQYMDDIYRLILDNRLPVFDANQKIIPFQTIIDRYNRYDTIINCLWTRPKFIDNIYYASFDGVLVKRERPTFDTSRCLTNPQYISFIEKKYDDNGNYLSDEWAFMIRENDIPISLNALKNKLLKNINPSKVALGISKRVQTNKNEMWINEHVEINGIPYAIDSCMALYSLQLNNNFEFEQKYSKDTLCTTTTCAYEEEVGIEGELEDFFAFSESVQYYQIKNPKGYWDIMNNTLNDYYLNLYSLNGSLLATFKIQTIVDNSLILRLGNQKIVFKKNVKSG